MAALESVVLTALPGIPLIRSGDDLAGLILISLSSAGLALQDGDVVVVGQKVVSKAEGRLRNLDEVTPGEAARRLAAETDKDPRLVELILAESRRVLRTRPGLIVVEHRLGFICANAGIDHSNVAGEEKEGESWVLLLPENPDASAHRLRQRFTEASGARVAVLVIDSHGRAWRMGTVGVVIGASGFPCLLDLRGEPDLFGYRLRVTEVGLGDEVAAAASMLMGQAAEARPVIHLRGLRYPPREGSLAELLRPADQDLFR
ncbi:MAG TPA: coenzyme F420-0:L-glutamate ligase [Anaerolineales bacterium]|nr:coenzyme F420-0:L-glutamate ligase [Anaerolineales bacterium]